MWTDSRISIAARFVGALSIVALVAGGIGCSDLAVDVPENYFHPAKWAERGSENFHGQFFLDPPNDIDKCTSCHGEDYSGGSANVACASCHEVYPHETGFGGDAKETHAMYMREEAGWDLSTCTSCHGVSYDGNGTASKSCLTCHTDDEGPEACNTCHGGNESGMPPPDLYGRTETSLVGVGAHAAHASLGEGTETCANCHAVPETYSAAGHIDTNPPEAEITFGGISAFAGASPTYDRMTGTCGTTYCHGGFTFTKDGSPWPFGYTDDVIVGNSVDVTWTGVGTGQAVCGSCHGLPPTGHWDRTQCESCHPRGPGGEFPDPATHVDGRIDAIGVSRSAE